MTPVKFLIFISFMHIYFFLFTILICKYSSERLLLCFLCFIHSFQLKCNDIFFFDSKSAKSCTISGPEVFQIFDLLLHLNVNTIKDKAVLKIYHNLLFIFTLVITQIIT